MKRALLTALVIGSTTALLEERDFKAATAKLVAHEPAIAKALASVDR